MPEFLFGAVPVLFTYLLFPTKPSCNTHQPLQYEPKISQDHHKIFLYPRKISVKSIISTLLFHRN